MLALTGTLIVITITFALISSKQRSQIKQLHKANKQFNKDKKELIYYAYAYLFTIKKPKQKKIDKYVEQFEKVMPEYFGKTSPLPEYENMPPVPPKGRNRDVCTIINYPMQDTTVNYNKQHPTNEELSKSESEYARERSIKLERAHYFDSYNKEYAKRHFDNITKGMPIHIKHSLMRFITDFESYVVRNEREVAPNIDLPPVKESGCDVLDSIEAAYSEKRDKCTCKEDMPIASGQVICEHGNYIDFGNSDPVIDKLDLITSEITKKKNTNFIG